VKQIRQSQGVAGADPIDQAQGKLLLRAMEASSSEMAALAARFNVLGTATGRLVATESPQTTTASLAQGELPVEIKAVEPEYAGRILSRGMLWGGAILTFAPLLTFFGGLGLLAWATTILEGVVPPVEKFTAFGMIAVGIIGMVLGITVALGNPSYLANRYLQKRLRRELARRPKRIIDPGNPEALFVEIVPKANWGRLMLDNASDVGLLLLDRAKREILFEGDHERFRISVDAITYCGFEEFVYRQGHSTSRYYHVVLRIENPTQFWEAPIRLRTGAGLGGTKKRKKKMTLLFNSVQQMRAGQKAAATT
jgi:hypothetical protein